MTIKRQIQINDKTINLELNKLAKQSNGSVLVSSGGTQVLVTACANKTSDLSVDFLPLTIEYAERTYAAGRIPGGYGKREGRPSELQTLTARVLDRPLRPCFPKNYHNDTVVTALVLSYEAGHSPNFLALLGASCALTISDIPFNGPIASLRVGLKDGEFIIDPPEDTAQELDLTIACKKDSIVMVEAGAKFIDDEKMLEAIDFAHKAMQPLIDVQVELQKEIGKDKWELELSSTEESNNAILDLRNKIEPLVKEELPQLLELPSKKERNQFYEGLCQKVSSSLNTDNNSTLEKKLKENLSAIKTDFIRNNILEEGRRIGNRTPEQIRQITCEVGLLSKTHGSALFTRGETQALGVTTLASLDEQQRSETLWNADFKQSFLLHYNFPPFSVGEARPPRSPGRREIGHGNLARKALEPTLPSSHDFEYSIRVVSEILECNGSSSMASVCAGSMALLQAGVPIKTPIAGIAMGLVKEGDNYKILSDISGEEDHLGDMDFKVCGTENQLTALQMDIKIPGITMEVLKQALQQAREGRKFILKKMDETINEPKELSELAPRIFKLKVKSDQIKDIIGPAGKTIRKITSQTGVKIDITDDGLVSIVAPTAHKAQAVKAHIRACTTNPLVGEVYLGKVVRITEFGAFIEIKPGLDGLCHISQLDEKHIENVEDLVNVEDEVMVKIIDIDRQGRIKLSRKDAIGQQPMLK